MKLSDLLLYLKLNGEAIVSVEDLKKVISCEDDFPDVQVLHIDPPIDPKIMDYYGERRADE